MIDSRFLFGLVGVLAFAAAPVAAERVTVDSGTYKVYQHDRALGAETFSFERAGDSVLVYSHVYQTIPDGANGRPFEKTTLLIADAFDFGLRHYHSKQTFDGVETVRAIVPLDTALSVYRESAGRGEATSLVRPPGRLYVIDAQVFTLFDVACRTLHRQSFDERPVMVVTLGTRDSAYAATATDLGAETIRWGAKPVQARKLALGDSRDSFLVWISPTGQMLRLQHVDSGLRVERDAPPVKPAARRGG